MAYVMGHRYLRLNKPQQAAAFFQETLELAPPDSPLAKLAATDAALLVSAQGLLTLTNPFAEELTIEFKADDKEAQLVHLAPQASVTHELPAGKYRVAIASGPEGVRLSRTQLNLAAASRAAVQVESPEAAAPMFKLLELDVKPNRTLVFCDGVLVAVAENHVKQIFIPTNAQRLEFERTGFVREEMTLPESGSSQPIIVRLNPER
jgi:hypothetical protein